MYKLFHPLTLWYHTTYLRLIFLLSDIHPRIIPPSLLLTLQQTLNPWEIQLCVIIDGYFSFHSPNALRTSLDNNEYGSWLSNHYCTLWVASPQSFTVPSALHSKVYVLLSTLWPRRYNSLFPYPHHFICTTPSWNKFGHAMLSWSTTSS